MIETRTAPPPPHIHTRCTGQYCLEARGAALFIDGACDGKRVTQERVLGMPMGERLQVGGGGGGVVVVGMWWVDDGWGGGLMNGDPNGLVLDGMGRNRSMRWQSTDG